jgi:twinkle protein
MLNEKTITWAQDRGISRKTLELLGVESDTAAMPPKGQPAEVIVFPYKRGGTAVNAKYRTLDGKGFRQDKGGELRFWNLDQVLGGDGDTAYVVEGEMDALALVESGFNADQVLSVPNGSPPEASDDPTKQDRYRFVDAALDEGLSRFKKFVMLTDQDAPGRALRHDLVRLLGAARCYFVDFPEGIKDANEFLSKHGPESLRIFIDEDTREWPVTGLYGLSEIPEPAKLEVWRPGFPEWESKLAFAPTMLSVVTGHPGHGKSTFTLQLWYQICRDYGISAAIASFETRAKPHHQRNIRQFMFEKPDSELTQEERAEADTWNEDHLRWLIHPNRKPTLKWVLDRAEVAIARHGCRVLVIDPWNKLESDRGTMREHEWIGVCLDELMDFARDMNVHVQVVAHPSKAMDFRQRTTHPVLEDISGSKAWDTKPDQGICVHRPEVFKDGVRKTEADLYVLKARHEELGYPCQLGLDYDLNAGVYRPTDYRAPMRRAG